MQYLALLRGVNVGGKNPLPMAALKNAFEQQGFYDVKTYLNSGNIIFSSDNIPESALKEKCEKLINAEFQLTISLALISAADFKASLAQAPSWWNHEKDSKHNIIVVIPPAKPDEIFKAVGESKPEYEKIDYHGMVIFWSAPLRTFSRGRWAKVSDTRAYKSITIRNANTALNLAKLLEEQVKNVGSKENA